MSFWAEKQSRHFFISLVLLAAVMFLMGWLFNMHQGKLAKEMLLAHDGGVASALLRQGLGPEEVAAALRNTEVSQEGKQLLLQLGLAEKAPMQAYPAAAELERRGFQAICLGILALAGTVLGLAGLYLIRREQVYRSAVEIVEKFADGDFSAHLPRLGSGTLYQMFALVDGLANSLKAKNESEHKSKEFLKDTLSDISHQLKTPMAALSMYNEIIAAEPDNQKAVAEFTGKAGLALGRMEWLIQSLLAIACMEAGSIVFQKTNHFVADIVEYAVRDLTAIARKEQKELIINGERGEKAACDLHWTGEAISNIVKNALGHICPGGHVWIEWKSSPAMLEIRISDDGEGIPQEDLYHIFKRFYRSRGKGGAQGAGLGLPLAKAIMEKQGGMVSAQSPPGMGAVFTLAFLTEM